MKWDDGFRHLTTQTFGINQFLFAFQAQDARRLLSNTCRLHVVVSVLCVKYDCCCLAIWPKLTIYGEHGRICLCLKTYEFWQTLSRSEILCVAANYTVDYLHISCCCRSLEFVLKECLNADFVLRFTEQRMETSTRWKLIFCLHEHICYCHARFPPASFGLKNSYACYEGRGTLALRDLVLE